MNELPNIEPLVRGASRGDRRSEERLFALLYKFVTASLKKHWRSSFSSDELNDILMETLEKLLATFRDPEKTERVIEQGRLFGFVHVVAEHTALDHNRKRSRKEKVFISVDDGPDDENAAANWEARLQPADKQADIADVILGGMEAVRILSDLDDKYRKVIEERVSGLEYEEIAENNGISVSNARQIHKRGVTMLRQKLIAKHKTVLASLSSSQNAVLRRLYLREEVTPESPCSEEDALEAFYRVLIGKGIFLIIITLGILV
ncbi:MAG TPA: sigma-70 family RNA polymerase sigma factor [Candidatus Kapabacteria bacterium]|nr:sigma-70 family RNA polymerase sigma factor [Candidatus Kapabacteria bacterium]